MYLLALALIKPLFWLFGRIEPMAGEFLTAGEYLLLFIVNFVIAFGILAVQMVRFFRRTPNENRRTR